MAAPRLKVTYADGREVTIRCGPKAQVAFERQYKTTLAKYTAGPAVEHTYYLAWVALHQSGQESADFDEFLELLDDVDNAGTEPLNPTHQAQSPENSSS